MDSVDSVPGDHVTLNLPNTGSATNGSKKSGLAPGVLVKNGLKAYGNRPPVLCDFNMRVERGTIYGLLGSSGCGKTTILSCIVGLRKLDAGEILVCGAKPGTRESGIPGPRVGYMPQDIALYLNMTIKEILQYYGRIYGMTQEDIEKRMEYMMSFLDLPDSSRVIGTMSGGQQRRMSLAVSLVHQPELIILDYPCVDEPTVGVDPLLREKIWEHLLKMVRTKKSTIIVTTHYIEEARQANCVGLMRNGRLLCEKSPNALLEEHNADLLEDIVLKLCRKDELNVLPSAGEPENEVSQALQEISFYSGSKTLSVHGKPAAPSIAGDRSPIVGLKFKRRFTEENMGTRQKSLKRQQSRMEIVQEQAEEFFYSRADRIRALIIRNYLHFFRNYFFVFALLCIPALQIIIIQFVIGKNPKHMQFGMLNYETPEIGMNGTFCPYETGCLTKDDAGCKFVSTLPEESVVMRRVNSPEEGLDLVQQGSIWGYITIPENFSENLYLRASYKQLADNESIDGSTISIKMDMSHYLASSLLIKTFYENYQTFVQSLAKDCNQDTSVADIPLEYRAPVYGELETGYQEFIAPGALLVILYFVPLAAGGIAYIQDKKHGTLDRSMVAGVTTFDVVAAFMVTEGSLIVFQAVISFIIMVFGFGMVIHGSTVLFFILLLLDGIAGLSLGFLIAMLVDEEMEAVIVTLGLYTPILILSGIIWPLEGVHPAVQFISYCLPSTYPVETLRSIVSRGWGFTHSHVWPGFATLVIWCVLTWILTALAYRARK